MDSVFLYSHAAYASGGCRRGRREQPWSRRPGCRHPPWYVYGPSSSTNPIGVVRNVRADPGDAYSAAPLTQPHSLLAPASPDPLAQRMRDAPEGAKPQGAYSRDS